LDYGVLLQVDCDFRRVEERVVDEAVMYGAFNPQAVCGGKLELRFDFNAEVVEAGGVFGFVGQDTDTSTFGG
jgi:hypothetical protein